MTGSVRHLAIERVCVMMAGRVYVYRAETRCGGDLMKRFVVVVVDVIISTISRSQRGARSGLASLWTRSRM